MPPKGKEKVSPSVLQAKCDKSASYINGDTTVRETWVKKLKKFLTEAEAGAPWKQLVSGSKLLSVLDMPLEHVDHALVYAFIERWNPLYNTFDMPFGRMSVTLHDMQILSNLPINGKAIVNHWSDAELRASLADHLGLTEAQITESLKKSGIKSALLETKMRDTTEKPEVVASCFLMLLLGVTLVMNKSTNRVDAKLLELVACHEKTKDYAWGVGALAYLYRQLGDASREGCTMMPWFVETVLYQWIWWHFPDFRGQMDMSHMT